MYAVIHLRHWRHFGVICDFGMPEAPFSRQNGNFGMPEAPFWRQNGDFGMPEAPLWRQNGDFGMPEAPFWRQNAVSMEVACTGMYGHV